MIDKRELILVRLLAIGTGLTGIVSSWRNRGELKSDKRPAFVVLDGDERNVQQAEGRGRVAMSPTVMEMTPQMFVLLVPRDTAKNEGVGAELSAWRAKLLKALATDAQLIDLVGPNGQIIYRNMLSDMKTDSTLYGELQFDFAIRYVLNPSDL